MTRARALTGEWLPAIVVFVAGIAIWEGVVRGFGIQNFLLPAPSSIVQILVDDWNALWSAAFFTFREALAGFAVGCSAGFLVAVVVARFRLLQAAILPYAAGELAIFRRVRLPSSLPYVFAGLKVATVLAMIGAIVGDYFGGATGALGVQIRRWVGIFAFDQAWAGIVLASALGIVFYGSVALRRAPDDGVASLDARCRTGVGLWEWTVRKEGKIG